MCNDTRSVLKWLRWKNKSQNLTIVLLNQFCLRNSCDTYLWFSQVYIFCIQCWLIVTKNYQGFCTQDGQICVWFYLIAGLIRLITWELNSLINVFILPPKSSPQDFPKVVDGNSILLPDSGQELSLCLTLHTWSINLLLASLLLSGIILIAS